MAGKLPPLSQVRKARDVEDPVNVWVHRPLEYGLAALLIHTPLTPNMVTLLAMLMGIAAAVLWIIGTPTLMLAGGVALWSASILDGVDGIVARAKQMQSELGRALDGSADMVVAFVTVAAAFYHIWTTNRNPWLLPWMAVALVTAVAQIYLYDFYKECYINSLDPSWDGRTTTLVDTAARLEQARSAGGSWVARFAWSSYVGMLTLQDRLRGLTNPPGRRDNVRFVVSEEASQIYKRHNYWPMQLWAMVSLCPHTYIMSICAIFDRLDLYLWFRVVVGNAIFVLAIIWQRIATVSTLRDLQMHGVAPVLMEKTRNGD